MDTQLLDLMTKIYIEMQEMKSDIEYVKTTISNTQSDTLSIKSDLLDLKYNLKDLIQYINEELMGLKEIKESQLKMDYHLVGKIDALLEAREDQLDLEDKVAYNLQKVEHKLDKLELKMIRNIFSDKL